MSKLARRRTRERSPLPQRAQVQARFAQAALTWERLAPALWPSLGLAGVYAVGSLLDAGALIGPIWRGAAPLLLVAAVGTAVYGLRGFRFPTRSDALRRLERDSELPHRPLTTAADRLAPNADAVTEALWREHRRRIEGRGSDARAQGPNAAFARRDPFALRIGLGVALVAALAVAGPEWDERLLRFGAPLGGHAARTAAVDAWITPPDYVQQPPIYLTAEGRPTVNDITAVAGSKLSLRVTGASRPPRFEARPDQGDVEKTVFESIADNVHALERALEKSGDYDIRIGARRIRWRIEATPDTAPMIAFTDSPKKGEDNALEVSYRARDDFGVTDVKLHARLADAPNAADAVLEAELPLADGDARRLDGAVSTDLRSHPWAGLEVSATLIARDAAGQEGRSATIRFRLPERAFQDPLARAAVERRRELSRDPTALGESVRILEALAILPDRYFDYDAAAYLGLRAARHALAGHAAAVDGPAAPDPQKSSPLSAAADPVQAERRLQAVMENAERVARAQSILWGLALHVERGGLAAAERALRQAQQALMEALAQGASEEEIAERMSDLRDAVRNYLQALAADAARRLAEQGGQAAPAGEGMQIGGADLEALLDALQELAQTGSTEAAQALLSQLQQMLSNLQITFGAGGEGDLSEFSPFGDALEQLSDIIGRQRQFLDETFRGGGGRSDDDLASRQGELGDALNELRDAFGGSRDPRAGEELENAEEAMRRAEDALRDGRLNEALQEQTQAIERLRDGAERLAQEESRILAERAGRDGEALERGDGSFDPLGRPAGGGLGGSGGVQVPGEAERQRAREILEELKARAADASRSEAERDYIRRLLDLF